MYNIKHQRDNFFLIIIILCLTILWCNFFTFVPPTKGANASQKSIVFEGAYDGITSESIDNASAIFDSFKYSEIKFFSSEPDELSYIEYDRPLQSDDIQIAQQKLNTIREITKNIIIRNNLQIIDELCDVADFDNFIIGEYSPVVKLIVDTDFISSININKIEKILQSSSIIEEVYVSEISEQVFDELTNAMPIINVFNMVNSGTYTGRNINVGIADGAIIRPQTYPNDFEGRNITFLGGSSTNDHSDQVAMIAVGNNGIARGSNIISTIGTPYNNNYLTNLIDNNANVINTSFGAHDTTAGTYTSIAKEVDSIIRNSFITMVGSAGNINSLNGNNVTSPKTAYNYITVGATNNINGDLITNYSCFNETYGVSKPNICAPGDVVTNAYNHSGNSGTSFASPQVAGCIALLMEEFPYLVAYPELCLAIITASASPMDNTYNITNGDNHFDSSGLHNQIGSGLLNYEQMRVAANNYLSVTRKANSNTGMLDQNLTFTATKNQRLRASLAWLAQGQDDNNVTDYDLYLQKVNNDGTVNTLMYINGSMNNVEFLDYSFEFDGTYRLAIKQCGVNTKKDFIGMSYVLINQSVGGSTSGGIRTTQHVKISPDNYGFDGEYHFSEIEQGVTTHSGEIVNTKRLRCGFISNTYLALSAKRNNAGLAYLEYETTSNIYGIKYDMGLWSAEESLILNSSIRLEAKDNFGQWQVIRVFNPKQMSTDKDNLLTYFDILPYNTKSFRFIVETNQVQNENNRGRIVIGDIDIVGL